MNKANMTSRKPFPTSFKEALILQRGGFLIYDFSLLDHHGKRVWFLFAVAPSKETALVKALNTSGINADLNAFGKILATGEGRNPPKQLKKELFEEHGVV